MTKQRLTCYAILGALLIGTQGGCIFLHGQRYRHFTTRTPLPDREILVLGFMGGREPWNNDARNVRKLALKLRAMNLHQVQIETVENQKRELALQLIRKAFDRNQDGQLDAEERATTRLILYGQSFGGAAVVKLARQLKAWDIPILLTVQIDSVGRGDRIIPSNVRRAANLFQRNGLFIKGEKAIRPEAADKTAIIGNYQFDYRNKNIDISEVSWLKKIFRVAHTRMEYDPEVWAKVEALILSEIERIKKAR
ncbi:MAG: hypothetical protein AB1757_11305 [Acidobacteriota bacterium]